MSSFPFSQGMARATFALGAILSLNDHRVRFVKRMALKAVRLRGVYRHGCFAAKQVFSTRHRFQMVWIATRRITAEMIDVLFLFKWADE
jgi:hypothetical protein